MATITLKRVYDPPAKSDGMRILVERLWPRGMRKEEAKIDFWVKELAPSADLRRWYGHDPEKWPEFRKRYRRELTKHKETIEAFRNEHLKGDVTFVFAARDLERNSALVLKAFLEGAA